ncbi:OTU domain-containing protein 4 isoform X2 [Channa argus]|uniref:OTU domain-containing protein 4 isoform X2 n=1 Tax=Channa argus TaxID=215402 RepID=UPI003521F1A9
MDVRENMQSNDERGAEKLMDDYLKSLGLHRKKIAKDGSCLFRAVAEQVLHSQNLHTEVRARCVEYLKKNRDIYEAFVEGDFEHYLYKLQDPQQWVGEVEINALAVIYKRDFLIYQEPGKPPVQITDNNFKDKVQLCFLNGNHYDSVYPSRHIKDAAICQSILYELLYDNVLKMDRNLLSGVCQRSSRPNDLLSDDNMAACLSSDESELDSGEALRVENGTSMNSTRQSYRGRGRGRLSERLRRSLNPTLYRNVEYDVWQKTKKAQQKMDYCIAAEMHYTVGDRCQVRLDGRNYNAIIEVPPNNSMVTVHIEDLGKRQVPLWSVHPPSDENSWSLVVNKDKKLSNGHGDWEERGKGRAKGKCTPASSSVSQATSQGSTGRVQKQHSWPPQATVEEHGGAKPNRKCLTESLSFGLTEKERLAKEEEKRNVALVEIQLRDERSFPALGAQPTMHGDGGKRKGGEKKRSQRNKMRSPVEDVRAQSPSAGDRPKSSTPPPATTTANTAPTANTTTPTNPTLPAAKPTVASPVNPEPTLAQLSSRKTSTPDKNMAAAVPGSTSCVPLTSAAPSLKTNAQSYASTATVPPSSAAPAPAPAAPAPTAAAAAAAAPGTKRPAPSGPPPHSIPSSASVFSFVTPVLPAASPVLTSSASSPSLSSSSKIPTSSSSSLPSKSSPSPPPSSSVPPPTFIAPIAPSPVAAQGFLPSSSFPRSSPPVASLLHSTSPSSLTTSSSVQTPSCVIHPAAQVHKDPPAQAQTPNSLPQFGGPLTPPPTSQSQSSKIHPQVYVPPNQCPISVPQTSLLQPSLPQNQTQNDDSLPPNISVPQMQAEVQSSLPHTDVSTVPQSQIQPPVVEPQPPFPQVQASVSQLQPQCEVQYPSQSQSEVAQVQSSHPPPEASYPQTHQTTVPVSDSMQPQPSITQPHLHSQVVQAPHPSQVPHPSLSLSASPTHNSLQTQTHNTQNTSEAAPPPTQYPQPQPESLTQPPTQQSHPPHPQVHSAHPPPPPHPSSIPGSVPLQQLSQLYQDVLYPGFPQGQKGDVVPTPAFSSSKTGDDLPQDVNVLRFFFNLGVKAYSMPLFPPYMYLISLQQAYTMHPKVPSRSPSPTPQFPPSNPPSRHQEAYSQYSPTSASVPTPYDHQVTLTEPPRPSEHSFNQPGYPAIQPPPQRMPWQQQQMAPPRNSGYSVPYSSAAPQYPVPMASSQGYHSGQGSAHPSYPTNMPPYHPSSMGYHPTSIPEGFQGSQGTMAQHQSGNGDTVSVHGLGRVPGFKTEQEESVLLVDPPLNNMPIHVTMTTVKPTNSPGSHDIASIATMPVDNNRYSSLRKTFGKVGVPPEPGKLGFVSHVAMPEGLSVGCSTEEDWKETEVSNPPTPNFRGTIRKPYRGRGRGGRDGGRGSQRRRQGGDMRGVYNHALYGPSLGPGTSERGYH